MKIQIENLKAQMQGRELNIHQKANALIEFNKLLDYVEELEQCNIANVVDRLPEDKVIRDNAREMDEKQFEHWWWETTVYKGN